MSAELAGNFASEGRNVALILLQGKTMATAGNPTSESAVTVKHIRVTATKSFAEVQAAFEQPLGRFDPAINKSMAEGGDLEAARTRLKAMTGPSGFMLFETRDHGSLLWIVGRPRKAVQYVVGNPLYAIEMTRHAIGSALYAPLRVLIFEKDGSTCIEYDLPSSLFGQFGNGQVDAMAASLDQKLADLVAEAIR
jgi:uncharacterized protein (DUF302 family)